MILSNNVAGIDDSFNKTDISQTGEFKPNIDSTNPSNTDDNINTNAISSTITNVYSSSLDTPILQTTLENNFNSNLIDDYENV